MAHPDNPQSLEDILAEQWLPRVENLEQYLKPDSVERLLGNRRPKPREFSRIQGEKLNGVRK